MWTIYIKWAIAKMHIINLSVVVFAVLFLVFNLNGEFINEE
jgi:hypothetical protein